jgi:hypothetical protein
MNVNSKFWTSAAILFALSPLCLPQRSLAENNCKEVKGKSVEAFNPASNAATGNITDGGWLDGTTVSAFNSQGVATHDPTEFNFTSTFTLTTDQGQLKGSRNFILDLVTGQGVSMVKIDPATSTGIFAGATGVLFLNLLKSTTVTVGPYYEVVGGQVCFAAQEENTH